MDTTGTHFEVPSSENRQLSQHCCTKSDSASASHDRLPCQLLNMSATAAAAAFTEHREKYPLVLSRVNQLVERIAAQGPGASVDVDQAALRVTLDVIGLVRRTRAARSGGPAPDEQYTCQSWLGTNPDQLTCPCQGRKLLMTCQPQT